MIKPKIERWPTNSYPSNERKITQNGIIKEFLTEIILEDLYLNDWATIKQFTEHFEKTLNSKLSPYLDGSYAEFPEIKLRFKTNYEETDSLLVMGIRPQTQKELDKENKRVAKIRKSKKVKRLEDLKKKEQAERKLLEDLKRKYE